MNLITESPPQDMHAEAAVVGSMLADASLIPTAVAIVESEDFHDKTHRIVFDAAYALYRDQGAVDWVMLSQQLSSTQSTFL